MKRFFTKGMKGIALLLAGIMAFSTVFMCEGISAKAVTNEGVITFSTNVEDGVNVNAYFSFIANDGTTIGSSHDSASALDIPLNTVKIKVTVEGENEYMRSMRVFIKDATNHEPDDLDSTEHSARTSLEQDIWDNGSAEFDIDPTSHSYVIRLDFNKTKSVRWRYPEDRGTGDTKEDEIIEHARFYRLNATNDDDVDVNDYTEDKDHNLTIGETYYFLLIPDYGYQVSSLQINGGPTMSPITGEDNMGVFKFTMTNQNFHFKGIVKETEDIVESYSATVTGGSIKDGENATDSGNVRLNIEDTDLDDRAEAVAGEGATAFTTVDLTLEKVVSQGDGNYWTEPIATTTKDVTIGLTVDPSELADGETFGVVRNHEGTLTLLDSSYNTATEMLTFPSDSFSEYTIVKIPGEPKNEPEPEEEKEADPEYYDDSWEGGNEDKGEGDDDSTPPAPSNYLGFAGDGNKITTWSDVEKMLAGADKSTLLSMTLTGSNKTIPASVFNSLNSSKASGLHVFTNYGFALTFAKGTKPAKQGDLDVSAKVTRTDNSLRIAFNKAQSLAIPTALHTTVPKGTKNVKLYYVDPDGKKVFLRNLTPNKDGQVVFLIGLLGTYELVY